MREEVAKNNEEDLMEIAEEKLNSLPEEEQENNYIDVNKGIVAEKAEHVLFETIRKKGNIAIEKIRNMRKKYTENEGKKEEKPKLKLNYLEKNGEKKWVAHPFSRKSNQQETKKWCGTNFQEKVINRKQKSGGTPLFKKKQSTENKKWVRHPFSRKSNQQETKNWFKTNFQEKQPTGNKKVVCHHFS